MSDHFPIESGQDDAALAPELARLDELLLAEGRRWRRNEPSTVRLERHVRAFARSGASLPRKEERMLTERNQASDTPTPQPAPRRPPSRWRGPLAAVATVLLVTMACGVFTFMSSPDPRQAGTGTGQHAAKATPTPSLTRVAAIQPKDTHLPMPKNAYLSDLSFSSAHDGWAVGGIRIPDQPGQDFSAERGVLVHYHDGVWTAARDSFPGMSLDSVSMVSADDGWAVGGTINPPDNSGGVAVLLHYTGGHWVKVDAPALAGIGSPTIRMLSPDFGYITGVVNVPSATAKGSDDQLVAVVVYQNGVWKAIHTPFAAFTSQVVMVSASEGWASTLTATPGKQQATIYHYLNGVWTKALTFPGNVTSMSAASRADVWALAYQCANCTEPPTLRIEHYNGTTWERVSPPSQSDLMKIPGFSAGALVELTIFDGAAGGVWIVCAAQDTTKPPINRTYTYSTAMWVYGLNGNDNWLSASPPATGGMVIALTADGNGGLWAAVQTDNPFGMSIPYTQGKDWKVYGRSR